MKKILAIFILLFAGIIFIAPKFIGNIVELERQNALMELNKTEGITITTEQYNANWFGAVVNSSLTINLDEEGLSEITLLLEENLSFGPIIIADDGWKLGLGYSEVSLNLATADLEQEVINLINEKIHLSALMGLNKNITTFISADKFSYTEQGNVINSLPASAQFTFIDNKKIEGEFSWAGVELKEQGDRFVIGKIAMSTQQEIVSGDYFAGTAILSGEAKFNVEAINLYKQGNHEFSLNGTELTSTVLVNNDLLSLMVNYFSNDVSASGQYFDKPSLDVELANVDIFALQELNNALAALSSNEQMQDQSDEILAVLSQVADKILVKDPILKLTNMSVVAPEGEVKTVMNLTIDKDLFDSNNINAMSFIGALQGDATGKVPTEFLAKFGVGPMVNSLVKKGYLTKQDDVINFDAKYAKNQLSLNGKPFRL